jgi:hypothetical protein
MPAAARFGVLLPAALIAAAVACRSGSTSVVGPSSSKCEISVINETPEVAASGGEGRLSVSAARECVWSASSQSPWISVKTTGGQGQGALTYSVLPNPAGIPRRGRLLVAEQTVDVAQAAAPCRFDVSPAAVSLDSPGGQVSVGVQGPDGCPWTSRSDVSWINSAPSQGTGSATIRIDVAPNATEARAGTLAIADAAVRVSQAGRPTSPSPPPPPTPSPPPSPPPPPAPACSYSIRPTYYNAGRGPDDIRIDVTAPSGCTWTTENPAAWVTVVEGQTGSSNGRVRLVIMPNGGPTRFATLTIAQQTFELRQLGPPPD